MGTNHTTNFKRTIFPAAGTALASLLVANALAMAPLRNASKSPPRVHSEIERAVPPETAAATGIGVVGAPILPGRVDGVDHDVRKNRYISFNPNNPSTPVALMVEMLDLGCSTTHARCIEDFDCKTCVGGGDNGDACHIDSDCDGGGVCTVSGETCDELAPARQLAG